jgi:hypothetical protein
VSAGKGGGGGGGEEKWEGKGGGAPKRDGFLGLPIRTGGCGKIRWWQIRLLDPEYFQLYKGMRRKNCPLYKVSVYMYTYLLQFIRL